MFLTVKAFEDRLARGHYVSRGSATSSVNRSSMSSSEKGRCLAAIDEHYRLVPKKPPAWAKSRQPAKKAAKKRAYRSPARVLRDIQEERTLPPHLLQEAASIPPVLQPASPAILAEAAKHEAHTLRLRQDGARLELEGATRAIDAARAAFEVLQAAGKADPRFQPDAMRASSVLVKLTERLMTMKGADHGG